MYKLLAYTSVLLKIIVHVQINETPEGSDDFIVCRMP